jgi:hypothetical protein
LQASKRARVDGVGKDGGQQPDSSLQVLTDADVLVSFSRLVNLGPEVITPESLKDLATFFNNYAGPGQYIPLNNPGIEIIKLLSMVDKLNSGCEIFRPMYEKVTQRKIGHAVTNILRCGS